MGSYGDSGAPVAGEVAPQAKQEARGDLQGRQAASEQLGEEKIDVTVEEGQVAYVAAAEHSNSAHLVEAGTLVKTALAPGNTSGIVPLVTREGDVWAKFINGVLVTDDSKVIAWCDEHTKICRRTTDPATKGWATLKDLSARKANREQLIDPSEMNADDTFPVGMVDNLRAEAAKAGSPGSDLVEAAETSRQSIESR